ncbi:MAG: hypothetical protein R3B48_10670 [Kofleriaceae bacterium]
MKHRLARLALLTLALAACQRDQPPPSARSSAAPSAATPAAPTAPATAAPGAISGTVVETMDAGGYTYALIDTGRAKVWVAGPQTKLAVGAALGAMSGAAMPGFHSETLNRTFDELYFIAEYALPGGAAPATPSAVAADTADVELSGKVVETMDAGGYTYALIDHGDRKFWVAGPETKLAVGESLARMSGSLMTAFRSETLKRTFDEIYFINAFPMKAQAASGAHPAAAAPAVAVEKIARAPGGKTVAEIFANKAALAGKPVVLRGKVVKESNGILGKNWLHLRDGTGAPGSDDLLVTTQASPGVGAIVVARGAVATDKDFGAGYRYDVLVEDAAITAE